MSDWQLNLSGETEVSPRALDSGPNQAHGYYTNVILGGDENRAYYDTPLDHNNPDRPVSNLNIQYGAGALADFREYILILRAKAGTDPPIWETAPSNAWRVIRFDRQDLSDPHHQKSSYVQIAYLDNAGSLEFAIHTATLEWDTDPFAFITFEFELWFADPGSPGYDWLTLSHYLSHSQQLQTLYLEGSPLGSHNVVPGMLGSDVPWISMNLGDDPINPTQGWRGWFGDYIFTLAGADISDPDTKVSEIDAKLAAGTLTEADLNEYFGATRWVWYKQNEIVQPHIWAGFDEVIELDAEYDLIDELESELAPVIELEGEV